MKRPTEIPDEYKRLGVSRNAGLDEIKKAYRKSAKLWHPDKHSEDTEGFKPEFVAIGEAYERLVKKIESGPGKAKSKSDFEEDYDYYEDLFDGIDGNAYKRGYRGGKNQGEHYDSWVEPGNEFYNQPLDSEDKIYKLGEARALLEHGYARFPHLGNAILGLKIYEQLGKINIPVVTKGISKTLENIESRPEDYKNPRIKEQIKELKEFAEKNASSRRKGIESKVSAGVAIFGLIGAVSFLSPNLTGNVIRNINFLTSSGIGIVLFLIGLVGSFFYFKKRKT